MHIQAWHWLTLGMILIVLEIIVPSFTLFWFGLAALIVGIGLWVFPTMAIEIQLMLWVMCSIFITWAWFKWIKPYMHNRTNAGLVRENTIGQIGIVIAKQLAHADVMVRFTIPVLGSDEWPCRCNTEVQIGDRVQVTDILGNTLTVVPYHLTSSDLNVE